jgi:hypothetical protein
MLNIGPNTIWLDLHGLLMFLILIFSAFLFGAIFFAKDPDERLVRRLKISAVVAFVLLMLLMISGMIPDINFAAGATFAHSTTNDFGTFTAQVTDNSLGNFTGPLLFDMMEHVTLIVPGLAAVVGFLIFYYGARVITNPTIKWSVLSLMFLAGVWTLTLGGIGVYITKILTFPVGQ